MTDLVSTKPGDQREFGAADLTGRRIGVPQLTHHLADLSYFRRALLGL